MELLLAESLREAHAAGALRSQDCQSAFKFKYCRPNNRQDLERVTVDTTVQSKALIFPTDAKLLHAVIKGLNRLVSRRGVSPILASPRRRDDGGPPRPCQTVKAASAGLRILRSRPGRIIRRKIEGQSALEEAFALPLGPAM